LFREWSGADFPKQLKTGKLFHEHSLPILNNFLKRQRNLWKKKGFLADFNHTKKVPRI